MIDKNLLSVDLCGILFIKEHGSTSVNKHTKKMEVANERQ